ncbi:KH domain-containing protein [Ligilactobacillus agilis]|uniref:KH domain-containing protein n=1 Tax=Ligilactobacillus agilis TaxID=1601 RepID=UPI001F57052F|nr:KH domain-containing protein [Ligilactobacillus agilis]UNL42263.1 KH domain-containing protein [Ligilactobacillus agilis]UNL58248.1 KH domain-containing protein [Ligilactobacillus agilis]
MTEADVKQLIMTIVAPLVADSEAIRIETKRDTRFLNFNLTVAKDDVGRVIGKHGRIAQALRTLVYSVRLDDKSLRARLNIVDD